MKDDGSLDQFLGFLGSLPDSPVTSLMFRYFKFSDRTVDSIAKMLKTYGIGLKRLELIDCGIGDEGQSRIVNALSYNSTLYMLYFTDTTDSNKINKFLKKHFDIKDIMELEKAKIAKEIITKRLNKAGKVFSDVSEDSLLGVVARVRKIYDMENRIGYSEERNGESVECIVSYEELLKILEETKRSFYDFLWNEKLSDWGIGVLAKQMFHNVQSVATHLHYFPSDKLPARFLDIEAQIRKKSLAYFIYAYGLEAQPVSLKESEDDGYINEDRSPIKPDIDRLLLENLLEHLPDFYGSGFWHDRFLAGEDMGENYEDKEEVDKDEEEIILIRKKKLLKLILDLAAEHDEAASKRPGIEPLFSDARGTTALIKTMINLLAKENVRTILSFIQRQIDELNSSSSQQPLLDERADQQEMFREWDLNRYLEVLYPSASSSDISERSAELIKRLGVFEEDSAEANAAKELLELVKILVAKFSGEQI